MLRRGRSEEGAAHGCACASGTKRVVPGCIHAAKSEDRPIASAVQEACQSEGRSHVCGLGCGAPDRRQQRVVSTVPKGGIDIGFVVAAPPDLSRTVEGKV